MTFTFDQTGNRELPHDPGPDHRAAAALVGGHGRRRQAARHRRLDPRAADGLGPLQDRQVQRRRLHHLQARPDYWGANEPTDIGQNNFDKIRYEYFRDPDVAFEGFKGDQFDWWGENRAKRWATAYDFPAVTEGRVVKELFPQTYSRSGIMVGFISNLR